VVRAAIQKSLPDFDVERFDKLEDYAMAFGYADGQHSSAMSPDSGLTGPSASYRDACAETA
jgi:hypothetical protein